MGAESTEVSYHRVSPFCLMSCSRDAVSYTHLENILDLVDSTVESSGKVPKEFNQQMKNWIHDLVSKISTRGWNNVPDMTLSILYGKIGIKDMNQLITYQYDCLLYTSRCV